MTRYILGNVVGNFGMSIDDVVSSLPASFVRHAVTLVTLLPMMELAYEQSHVALFRHDNRMLDFIRSCCTP